jgi:hypothetical protein
MEEVNYLQVKHPIRDFGRLIRLLVGGLSSELWRLGDILRFSIRELDRGCILGSIFPSVFGKV